MGLVRKKLGFRRKLFRGGSRALKTAGGELRLGTRVSGITVENGRAVGVALADGSELRSDHVISNADPGVTFESYNFV